MTRRGNPYNARYRRERRMLLAGDPDCVHCGAAHAREADHQPPLSRHDHADGTGCCVLVASCGPCQRQQALHLSLGLDLPPVPEPEPVPEPVGFAADDPVWSVPWLAELLAVPGDATWPRLMTVPHPRAVGSLGPEFCAWVESRTGGRLRWWQRLTVTRLLEIDAAGALMWEAAILSMARQLGKSWLLRAILLWRIHQSDRFGEEQLVLHTGKDVAICREVQRPARIWARGYPDTYTVREVNGQEEVAYAGDGFQSRWMIRAKEAVYGISATMVGVDEGWKVKADAIEEGVVPTMVEHAGTQLLLISTAHRAATALMLRRRADAVNALGSGTGDLLLEWSAPASADVHDRAGWRAASPHWTDRRERLIAQRVAAALAGSGDEPDPLEPDPVEGVRAQWLNIWPSRIRRPDKGEPLFAEPAWTAAGTDVDSVGPLVVGVVDQHGRGVAVAFCGTLPDGRLVVGGRLVGNRPDAWRLAARAAAERGGSVLVTAASLADDPAALDVGADTIRKASSADTTAALTLARDLLASGRLAHDRSPELDGQARTARVTEGARLTLIESGRLDLLIAALWAVRAAVVAPAPEPAIY